MRIWYVQNRPKMFNLNSWEKRNWGGEDEEKQTQTQDTTQTMKPEDYTESTAARGEWWNKLQDWGKSGTYGVDTGIYDDIYANAAKKVNQYYWGSPTGPGAIDKIKSNVAQRGVQDSPATGVLTSRMAAEESNKLGDLSTSVGTSKANAIESSRNNWLSSLMQLSGLKSGAYTSTGNATTTMTQPATNIWDTLGTIGGAAASAAVNYGTGDYMGMFKDLMGSANTPKSMSSPTDWLSSGAYADYM
jgi:hypothetical protein